MNHIRKQEWLGCAIAAAAMIADRGYDEVAAHWPDLDAARTRDPRELCALLEAVTDTEWRLCPCWHPRPSLREFERPPWPVVAWTQDAPLRPRFGQWIVLNDWIVNDPGESQVREARSYRLRDWVVACVLEPLRPEDLIRCRIRRRHESTPPQCQQPL